MNEPEDHQHSSPIKTPQQLVIVVVLAFVVPIALIVLVTQLVTGVPHSAGDDAAVRARIAPVGTVQVGASAAAPAATGAAAAAVATVAAKAGPADGKKVYDGACVACHGAGIAGAPKVGDKAAWATRIAQGANVLYDHAIKGFQGKGGVMPPKGGAMQLTDAEVKAAVDTMVAASK
jgi:cytochrome c5